MRGNIVSLYSFKIKTVGFTLEQLEGDFKLGKINKEEYDYLLDYYDRTMLAG